MMCLGRIQVEHDAQRVGLVCGVLRIQGRFELPYTAGKPAYSGHCLRQPPLYYMYMVTPQVANCTVPAQIYLFKAAAFLHVYVVA